MFNRKETPRIGRGIVEARIALDKMRIYLHFHFGSWLPADHCQYRPDQNQVMEQEESRAQLYLISDIDLSDSLYVFFLQM